MKAVILILFLLQQWPEYKLEQWITNSCDLENCRLRHLQTTILKRGPKGNHYRLKRWIDDDTSKESVEAYKKFAEEWIERDKKAKQKI
jgi:hypothetical protein